MENRKVLVAVSALRRLHLPCFSVDDVEAKWAYFILCKVQTVFSLQALIGLKMAAAERKENNILFEVYMA